MPNHQIIKIFLLTFLALGIHAAAAQTHTIQIGTIGSSTDAPLFIADANGYFKAEGISVRFIPFSSGGEMMAPLATGELDVAAGAVSAALYNASARGIRIRVVADKAHHGVGYDHAALLVRSDLVQRGKFKDFRDLKGLKVAVSGKGSGDESVLNEALKRGGLEWGDATPVYLGFAQHAPAFENGAIEAGLTSEPALSYILQAGFAAVFARIGQFYPDQQSAAVIYGPEFADAHPELAQRFMTAYIRGARFYNNAISNGMLSGSVAPNVIATLTGYSNIKDPKIYRRSTPPAIDPDGSLNLVSLQKDWQFFKDTGQLTGIASVGDVVDTSFVERALKDLGPYRPGTAP